MTTPTRLLCVVAAALILAGCPDKRPKYPACAGDKDCKTGEKCENKQCIKVCKADADCGPGKTCKDGSCEPIPGWCSADGDCPNGEVCKDHMCTACQSDAECGEGGKCKDGGCLRKGQCKVDEDCAEDEDCVKGVCVKGGKAGGDKTPPNCTLETVYFGFNEYTLSDDTKATLEKNQQCMSQTTLDVKVVGTTDPRGPDEYNISLSDDRAQSVITYLSRLGVEPARLHKVPLGKGEAQGTDDATWAKDRKVRFEWQQ